MVGVDRRRTPTCRRRSSTGCRGPNSTPALRPHRLATSMTTDRYLLPRVATLRPHPPRGCARAVDGRSRPTADGMASGLVDARNLRQYQRVNTMPDETPTRDPSEMLRRAATDELLTKLRTELSHFAVESFADAGRELHAHGHPIASDRSTGRSPFGHGSDETVAVSMLLRIAPLNSSPEASTCSPMDAHMPPRRYFDNWSR